MRVTTIGSCVLTCLAWTGVVAAAAAAELHVGPGQTFDQPTSALAAAKAGDIIVVHALPGGAAYTAVGLRLTVPRLTLRGEPAADGARPVLDGAGADLGGEGAAPRALIQIDSAAEGTQLSGLNLRGARNATGNAAGVRINQASGVMVHGCEISGNDMGVMSNGEREQMRDLRLLGCDIHDNGALRGGGRSHNLYLIGGSAVISGCRIHHSRDGHNLKTRIHLLRVEACWIHDAANRELDLVDAQGITDVADSGALIIGCVLAKAAQSRGNKTVLNIGQDNGYDNAGTCVLVHNTILTPYISPVCDVSAANVVLTIVDCLVANPVGGDASQELIGLRNGARASMARVTNTWVPASMVWPDDLRLDLAGLIRGKAGEQPPFVDLANGDLRLHRIASPLIDGAIALDSIAIPKPLLTLGGPLVLREYDATAAEGSRVRTQFGVGADLGAFEEAPTINKQ